MSVDELKTSIFTAEMADIAVAIVSPRHVNGIVVDSCEALGSPMLLELASTKKLRYFARGTSFAFDC